MGHKKATNKKLQTQQAGLAKAALIAILAVIFGGLGVVAYTQLQDDGPSEVNVLEEPVEDDSEQLTQEGDEAPDPSEDFEALQAEAEAELEQE
mgnify:CR=1 FL=1